MGLLLVFCLAARGEARGITDMFGRHFTLSDHPRKVYSSSPPDTWLLYALNPTMLAGLNLSIKEKDKRFKPH